MNNFRALGFRLIMALLVYGIVSFPALGSKLMTQQKSVSKALIVDGFSNHDWKQTSAVIKWILEGSGKFDVEVTTIPLDSASWKIWNPDFAAYDVVIQNTNNIHNLALSWPTQAQKNLEKYVKNGGGLYILHSANNAFPQWREYDKMIGLGWRAVDMGIAIEVDSMMNLVRYERGVGKGTSHGDRFDALIQVMTSHPINKGYPKSWKTVNTEVYSFPRGNAENITVLSSAYDSTDTKRIWPVEWIVSYGNGKVYNSSMGHLWHGETYPESYRCVGFQTTVIRAAEWLATGQVTYPMPASFPDGKNASLRPAGEFATVDED
ncbi:ThuA domain-containing protein [Algoriphagus sp. D3-2-R+10]|uniref:ThuA domain-containing protein n=1 Tax=Algoriphagus aurantiacus TaxID=3103948 RepID=UPI002B3CD67A|nr:ThuA domain-containing protein [Algoriphagus sp. D3-2-R+10]MEB2775351.1 ThuA domain-containing protein [Algoriphagus sp. D3-2-R+10]